MQPDVTLARIERELTLLVRRAQKVRLDSGVPVEPMEGAAYAVLVVLSDDGPLRGGELAGRLHVDASTVSPPGCLSGTRWVHRARGRPRGRAPAGCRSLCGARKR